MKWINSEQKVTVTIYDEEHEEHLVKTMTVEEMLDTYANEGCPTIYSNPERKKGHWLPDNNCYYETRYICSECKLPFHVETVMMIPSWRFCPNCGARME